MLLISLVLYFRSLHIVYDSLFKRSTLKAQSSSDTAHRHVRVLMSVLTGSLLH